MFNFDDRFIDDKAVAFPRFRSPHPAKGTATFLIAAVFIAGAAFALAGGHSSEGSEPMNHLAFAPDAEEASQALTFVGSPQSEYYSASGEGQFTPHGQLVGGR